MCSSVSLCNPAYSLSFVVCLSQRCSRYTAPPTVSRSLPGPTGHRALTAGSCREHLFGSLFWGSGCSPQGTRAGALFHLLRPKSGGSHPPRSPSTGSPWLSGGKGWLKSCILSVSGKRKQFGARRERPGSCCPLAGSPGSSTSVMEATEKRKTAGLWGWEQEGGLLVMND